MNDPNYVKKKNKKQPVIKVVLKAHQKLVAHITDKRWISLIYKGPEINEEEYSQTNGKLGNGYR